MVAAQPGHVCLIPVAYGSSTAWSCVLDPSSSKCLSHYAISSKVLLQKLVMENHSLQLMVLSATQVFCHNLDFPKGQFSSSNTYVVSFLHHNGC